MRFATIVTILCGLATLASATDDPAAPLAQRLVDQHEAVRNAALAELRALPEAERLRFVPGAVAGLGMSAPAWYQVKVLQAIGPAALPAVTEALGSKEPRVRQQALQVITSWPAKSVATLPILSVAVGERMSDRRWAASAIAGLGPAAAPLIPDLVRAIRDPVARDQEVLLQALGSLGSTGAPAAADLVGLLSESWTADEDHHYLRRQIFEVLPRIKPGAANVLPGVIPFLGDPALYGNARSIVKGFGAEALPYLIAALDDENAHVRAKAAEELRGFDAPEARAAIVRYEAAEPARVARAAAEETRRPWTKESAAAPIPPTAECDLEARQVASVEFDLGGHGSLLVTAHAAERWGCRPDVLRLWRRGADGYHLIQKSDEAASAARYTFTMATVAKQRLLQVSRVSEAAYRFDRFYLVGDDAALTAVTFTPPASGCGAWLPLIGREEYAGLEVRAEGETVRFGIGPVDLRVGGLDAHRETVWRGTLALASANGNAPTLRVATCQTAP